MDQIRTRHTGTEPQAAGEPARSCSTQRYPTQLCSTSSWSESEQLKMVETLDGFIMHCSVGAMYLIDKYRTEHLPKRSWLRCEIKRRIQANAKRFGHSLEPWMLDELLDAALCYLKVRNTSSITEMLYSLTGKRVSDSKLADYAQRTPRGFRRLPCSDTLINSVQGASFEIFEICV